MRVSKLSILWQATGLAEALNNETFVGTIFAPSDAAFLGLLEDLRLSPDELVTGHVFALMQVREVL